MIQKILLKKYRPQKSEEIEKNIKNILLVVNKKLSFDKKLKGDFILNNNIDNLLNGIKNIIANESFEKGEKFDLLTNNSSKISLVLTIKQGIISNTVFLARSKHFAKITIADNYNFDRFPFSDDNHSVIIQIRHGLYATIAFELLQALR